MGLPTYLHSTVIISVDVVPETDLQNRFSKQIYSPKFLSAQRVDMLGESLPVSVLS